MSPSIEKTPSVTMNLILAFFASSANFFSRSARSEWAYLSRCALHSRMPSIIEAWFNESLITASSGVRTASKKPPFASKQLGKRIVSSVPWNSLILA